MNYSKYKSTPHFPFSPQINEDDFIIKTTDIFSDVIISEKRDGENTSMYYNNKIHARSIDSGNHPSRSWVKGLYSRIKYYIPEGIILRGENLYAKHSIMYTDLISYFEIFQIQKYDTVLSWNDTLEVISEINFKSGENLITVPVLYKGNYSKETVLDIIKNLDLNTQEGIVVRNTAEFPVNWFEFNVAKWVRKNHVQTSEHWMNSEVIPNKLK